MADQDLDDELLALAGGGSDEDGAVDVKQSIESPGGAHQSSSQSHSNIVNTNGAPKLKGGRSDLGHGQASTPERSARMQSASMSEGSYGSRSSSEGAEERNMYPIEGKFTSQKDKKHVMSLPELERETILAERAAENDRRMQDLHLRRLYEKRAEAEGRANRSSPAKRKAGPHEEESPRKSSRTKTRLDGLKAGKANEALGDYKRRRDENALRGKVRVSGDRNDRLRSSLTPSDEESESEADGPSNKSQEVDKPVEDGPPGLYEYDYLRITRTALEKTCFYPDFEDKFIDYVVRVCLGPDHKTGESVYRIAMIKDYVHDKPYWMEGSHNGRPFVTTQHINLRIGDVSKPFPFTAISNSPFTQAEYDRWMSDTKQAKSDGVKKTLPPWTRSRVRCEESYQWLKGWFNRSFTDEDVNFKVGRSKVLQKEYIENRKTTLTDRYKLATEKGDDVTIARTEAELAELDKGHIFFGRNDVNFPKAAAPAVNKQQERLAELNRQNRAANTRDVRQAQLRERAAARKAAAAVERGEQAPDPFARVKTVPRTHFDGTGLDVPKPKMTPSPGISRTGTPVNGFGGEKKEGTPKPSSQTQIKTVKGLPVITHKPTDDEVIGAMDFGIDIEI